MKNSLTWLGLQFSKIEPRHIQLMFAVFALVVAIIQKSPMDDPGGTR